MHLRPLIAAAALAVSIIAVPTAAQAAGKVGVANEFGKAQADPTYATTLTLRGSGFQSIKKGHGGVYVFFGTVSGKWRPSQGGQVGTNYKYVPDSESRNNQGFQRFVAFPGSDTAGAANGGTIAADGSWSTKITVPGATFKTVDRKGKVISVDCRKVTCGIITIGAHGVKNAANESFTPVSFASIYDKQPAARGETAAPAAGDDAKAKADKPAKAADAVAAVDSSTAVVGRVLTFTGNGFTPGEQVIATLDDGIAAVGPLSAGPSGEIAGVLQLPDGTGAGTHVLRLTGAASGANPTVNFPIAADTTAVAASSDESSTSDWLPYVFLGLAILAFLTAVTFAALRFRSIRRRTRSDRPALAGTSGEAAHAL